MARIRTVKPEFFRHEGLQDLEIAHPGKYPMMVFAGLFGHCDKAGRFEWRPRQLKLDILPFLNFDMAETMEILAEAGQIRRYSIDGKDYGVIPTFSEHQRLSGKEAQEPEKHPAPPAINREATGKQPGSARDGQESQEGNGIGNGVKEEERGKEGKGTDTFAPAKPSRQKAEQDTEFQALCKSVWHAYGLAYQDRYGTAPVRNAKINANVKGFCQRIPAADAPHVAAWYVGHNGQRYVAGGHVFGLLLADAEKLRTEWATNRKITNSQSRIADQTEGRGQVWGALIAEAEERERNGAEQAAT